MARDVWEWTSGYFAAQSAGHVQPGCCAARNPRVTSAGASLIPGQPGAHIPRRVLKGGSHLCAPNYCLRYRPAARQGEAVDTSTAHIGFRCIVRRGGFRRPDAMKRPAVALQGPQLAAAPGREPHRHTYRCTCCCADSRNGRSVIGFRPSELGGRYWDRTSDLLGVNEALSR